MDTERSRVQERQSHQRSGIQVVMGNCDDQLAQDAQDCGCGYPAAGWRRKRCLCPYLGCREGRLSGLNEGQIIEYEEVPNKGKTSAENLKVQR